MSAFHQLAFVMTLGLATSAYAERVNWVIDSTNSPVAFMAVGRPGFLKINGENAQVQGILVSDDGKLSGTLSVPLADLKTGIDLRDDHMKDKYFQISKYPSAILVLDQTPSTLDGDEKPFTGKLRLKDVEKPVTGTLSFRGQSGKDAEGQAEFDVLMSDYRDLGVPSYKGITVAETVKVKVAISAKRN